MQDLDRGLDAVGYLILRLRVSHSYLLGRTVCVILSCFVKSKIMIADDDDSQLERRCNHMDMLNASFHPFWPGSGWATGTAAENDGLGGGDTLIIMMI